MKFSRFVSRETRLQYNSDVSSGAFCDELIGAAVVSREHALCTISMFRVKLFKNELISATVVSRETRLQN